MEDEGGAKMTKKRRCEVSREGISRNWANLPADILWLITTQLCYYERIRFCAVCKSWRESCHISSCDRLPILMSYNPSNLMKSCEFINMSVHNSRINDPTYAEDNRDMGHVVLSSKKGWLLLTAEEKSYELVIYNPFRNETINLPTVYFARKQRRLRRQFQAQMSVSPEEPGFMVFVIDGINGGNQNQTIRIATWQLGQATWKKYWFKTGRRFPCHCLDVVYNRNKGMFYCLFVNEWLGIFNPKAGEWSFLEPWIEKSTGGGGQLMETEEEPLLLTYHLDVFKLDRSSSRLSWMKQNDLGNRILFTSWPGSWPQTTLIAVPAEGELRNLANRVYFIPGNFTCFYSMGTRRYMRFTNKESASPKDNNNPEILSRKAWIDPPLLQLEYPME